MAASSSPQTSSRRGKGKAHSTNESASSSAASSSDAHHDTTGGGLRLDLSDILADVHEQRFSADIGSRLTGVPLDELQAHAPAIFSCLFGAELFAGAYSRAACRARRQLLEHCWSRWLAAGDEALTAQLLQRLQACSSRAVALASAPRSSNCGGVVVLLKWLASLLTLGGAYFAGHAEQLRAVFRVLLSLLHVSLRAARKTERRACVRSVVRSLANQDAAVLQQCLTYLEPSLQPYSAAVFAQLLTRASRLPMTPELRATVVKWYTNQVLSSPSPQPAAVLEEFAAFFAATSADDFHQLVVPLLARFFKRSPEVTFRHAAYLLRQYRQHIDTAVFAAQLLPAVATACASSSDALHADALLFLAEAAPRLSGSLACLLADFSAKQPQAAALALDVIARKASPDALAPVVSTALACLVDALKNATRSELRKLLFTALSAWLRISLSSSSLSSQASSSSSQASSSSATSETSSNVCLNFLLELMKRPADDDLALALNAFGGALTGCKAADVPDALVSALHELVASSQSPTKIATLVGAAYCLSQLGAAADERLLASVWQRSTIARLTSEPGLVSLVGLAANTVRAGSSDAAVLGVLAGLCLHAGRSVHAAVVAGFARLAEPVASSGDETPAFSVYSFADGFFPELLALFFDKPECHGRLLRDLFDLLKTDVRLHLSGRAYSALSILLHHPQLISSPETLHHHHHPKFTNWLRLRHRLGHSIFVALNDSLVVDTVVRNHVELLFNPTSPLFASATFRHSATASLTSIAAHSDAAFFNCLIATYVVPKLAQLALAAAALPPDAAAICALPVGELYQPATTLSGASSSSSAAAAAAASSSKPRSRKSANNNDDDEAWERQVRQRQQSAQVQLTPAQQQTLSAQNQLRETVKPLVQTLTNICDLLQRLSLGCPRQTERQITPLLPSFLAVVGHSVLLSDSESVLDTLKLLLRCCAPPFNQLSDLVAVMIFRFYGAADKTDAARFGQDECHRQLASVIRSLHGLCQRRRTRRLSGASLSACIPLFEIVVASSSPAYQSDYLTAPLRLAALASSSTESVSSSSSHESVGRLLSTEATRSASSSSLSGQMASTAISDILQLCALHVASSPATDTSLPWNYIVRILLSIFATSEVHRSSARRSLLICADALEDITELLDGLVSPLSSVRSVAFQTLLSTRHLSARSRHAVRPFFPPKAVARFWFGVHDVDPSTAELAATVRQRYDYAVEPGHLTELFGLLAHESEQIRSIAADAIVGSLHFLSARLGAAELLDQAVAVYNEHLESAVAKATRQADWLPQAQLPESKAVELSWRRAGAARLIAALAEQLSVDEARRAFAFVASVGLLDTRQVVYDALAAAGIQLIHAHAGDALWFVKKSEDVLCKAPDRSEYDPVRESMVVFLGELAQFVDDADRKASILHRLIKTLDTPSLSVQASVGRLIGPLIRQLKRQTALVKQVADELLRKVTAGSTFVVRQGGAFGLAGFVHGLGTTALSHMRIHERLLAGLGQASSCRHGCLLAFTELSNTFGRSFDAFGVALFAQLTPVFADTNDDVKTAVGRLLRALLNNMSEFATDLMLTPLLRGMDAQNAWRSRVGCIVLLAQLANSSPRQLAACLPRIVPQLQLALNDAHPDVSSAARRALGRVADVLTNDQIKPLAVQLIDTLVATDKKLPATLDGLVRTSWLTQIDPASLSLVAPVLLLGMRDRRSEIKCKAARFVGSLTELVERTTLAPYVPPLLDGLKQLLLDAIPVVRATASFALGSLVRGLGAASFPGLVDWLVATMRSDTGVVERDGAAQGLAQYFGAVPPAWLDRMLPQFLADTTDADANVREGALGFLSFLPVALGTRFEGQLSACLPSILEGLSDTQEPVRNVALRAARGVISHYSATSMHVLLPALETSMFHENWRIRQSSIQLTGDLIQQLLDSESAHLVRSSNVNAAPEMVLAEIIGRQHRNTLLAALAMCRQDSTKQVAQRAILVWKDCVSHSIRALREIMPLLMQRIVVCLASPVDELRTLASNTIAMLIAKLDASLLTNIFPLLSESLEDGDSVDKRQGACIGLQTVMETASRHQVTEHLTSIVPCINRALCDPAPQVREAAASAFDVLCNRAGADVLNEIIPPLLADLADPERKAGALEIFKQLVIVRSALILPRLLPMLTRAPITEFAARALSTLSEVAGPALYPHLHAILAAYVPQLSAEPALVASLDAILAAVKEEGLAVLFTEINKFCAADDDVPTQLGAVIILGVFAARAAATGVDWDAYIPSTLRSLLSFMTEPNVALQTAALQSLTSLERAIAKDEKPSYLPYVRDFLTEYLESHTTIDGFALPKALDPLLSILVAALLNAGAEQKVEAAASLAQLIVLTPRAALQQYILAISGPLLRVLGLRAAPPVKEAIIDTINTFLAKGGAMLRQLEAPLRTTYLKALRDPSDAVRRLGAVGLGHLQPIVSKIDPLVADLLSSLKDGPTPELMLPPDAVAGILLALRNVLRAAGKDTSQKVREAFVPALSPHLASPATSVLAAEVLAMVAPLLPDADRQTLLKQVLQPHGHQSYVLLAALLRQSPDFFPSLAAVEPVIVDALTNEADQMTLIGIGCLNYYWFSSSIDSAAASSSSSAAASSTSSASSSAAASSTSPAAAASRSIIIAAPNLDLMADSIPRILPQLIAILLAAPDQLKLAALDIFKRAIKSSPAVPKLMVKLLAPALLECIKDRKSVPVKMAAERTLLHLLQLRTDRSMFASHMAQLSPADVRNITDYVKRVLVKLAPSAEGSDDDAANDELDKFVIH